MYQSMKIIATLSLGLCFSFAADAQQTNNSSYQLASKKTNETSSLAVPLNDNLEPKPIAAKLGASPIAPIIPGGNFKPTDTRISPAVKVPATKDYIPPAGFVPMAGSLPIAAGTKGEKISNPPQKQ